MDRDNEIQQGGKIRIKIPAINDTSGDSAINIKARLPFVFTLKMTASADSTSIGMLIERETCGTRRAEEVGANLRERRLLVCVMEQEAGVSVFGWSLPRYSSKGLTSHGKTPREAPPSNSNDRLSELLL
jgi:hypothetical protein